MNTIRTLLACLIFGGGLRADEAEKPSLEALKKFNGHAMVLGHDLNTRGVSFLRVKSAYPTAFTDDDLRAALPHLLKLSKLEIVDLGGCQVTAAGLKELAALKGLKEVRIERVRVGDEVGPALATLAGLERLALPNTNFSDAGLAPLAGLKNLKSLDLTNTSVTAAGLTNLAGLKLDWLVLPTPARTDEGLRHLIALSRSVSELELRQWKLTDAALPLIAAQKDLKSLWLDGSGLSTLKPLAGLTGLTAFSVRGLKLGDAVAETASAMPKLATLYAGGTGVGDAGLSKIAGLKELRHLDVSDSPVTDAGLKAIQGLPKLAGLSLQGTKVSDAALAGLAGRKLESLTIPKAAQTDVGLRHVLAATAERRFLNLQGWAITDEGVKLLAGHPSLTRLNLGKTQVTDAGLAHVAKLTELRSIDLNDTPVSDAGLKALAGLKKLDRIDARRTKVTKSGAEAFNKSLPECEVELGE